MAIEKYLPGYQYIKFDGELKGNMRGTHIKKFKENPDIHALLFTYKVGGYGLNLPEANHIIRLELWWNPSITKQADGRAWRLGQTKTVKTYTILVQQSIEQRVLEICENKKKLESDILNSVSYEEIKLDRTMLGKVLNIYT